jgi:predicted MPP superfamily phosphohydrolase
LVIREVDHVSHAYYGRPIKIALITDIHINSPSVPPERVKDLVDRVNKYMPDLVIMPGDFIAGHISRAEHSAAFKAGIETGIKHLSALQAPAVATIGNHDAWYDAVAVTDMLERAGVSVLENQSMVFGSLCLVGLADVQTSRPDKSAYVGCAVDASPLVLTHSPDAWPEFRRDTVLALAGHTHGGQINLPFIGRRVNSVNLAVEHSYGFSRVSGVDMFVSAGVGTSILPARFRAPPEIVLITLQAAP